MEWIEEIENEIENLKENDYGIIVTKTTARGLVSADIVFPQEILSKEITEDEIVFKLVIDTFSLKLCPKLFCLTPYCFPHLADGRDLYKELRNSKMKSSGLSLSNLLEDIIEFMKINFERGGLIFCGNYYLGEKYDLRILQKGCENIIGVKENLVVNGKKARYNRILVLSDVYFLLFEQEKWYKNNLTLLFWSSLNNIEKIQKVKDNKTLILHWTGKDKGNAYLMSLTINNRESFIQDLLEKMKTFGVNFDIMKVNKNNQIEHNSFSSTGKLQNKNNDEKIDSKNELLGRLEAKKPKKRKIKNIKEEEEEDEEEEEEDDEEDEKEEKNKKIADLNVNKNEKNNNKEDNDNEFVEKKGGKEENVKDDNNENKIEDEIDTRNKEVKEEGNAKEEEINVDINIGKEEDKKEEKKDENKNE